MNSFVIRVCENPSCGMRYPLAGANPAGERCPVCLGTTSVAARGPLHAEAGPASPGPDPVPGLRLHALLDNLRSAWNVGAIFRSADGLGVAKLYLCGITPTPENESVRKTSLGAEASIPWEYSPNALTTAESLKTAGHLLIALEQHPRALPLTQSLNLQSPNHPILLIAGNEITGVDPGLLDLCDQIVHIPMRGRKKSLNVEVAFGIAAAILNRSGQEIP